MLAIPSNAQRKALCGISSRQGNSLVSAIRHISGMMQRVKGICFWQPKTFSDYAPYLQQKVGDYISESLPRAQKEWLESFAEYLHKAPRDWREQVLLPRLLLDYTDALESHLNQLRSLRNHPLRTSALCQLIWHVKATTNERHDAEIAQLVHAAERRSYSNPYTQTAHAKWCERNKGQIERLGPLSIYLAIFPQNRTLRR
jgi:hypothetical protein